MLRSLDPELCNHLEDNYIQAQLYGMRWARLLLGREFRCDEGGLLRLWDYMFACVLHHSLLLQQQEEEARRGGRGIEGVRGAGKGGGGRHPLEEQDDSDDDCRYTTTSAVMKASAKAKQSSPLLEALGDFMLAMLLHVSLRCCYDEAISMLIAKNMARDMPLSWSILCILCSNNLCFADSS